MLLMIDHYDSFTYNLVQSFGELGQEVKTVRNDEISIEEIEEISPEFIVNLQGHALRTKRVFHWRLSNTSREKSLF